VRPGPQAGLPGSSKHRRYGGSRLRPPRTAGPGEPRAPVRGPGELWDDEQYESCDRWDAWSIGETIAAFCKELGVKPDWDLWKDKPWAVDEARNQTPGSPYAAGGTGPPGG